MKKTATLIIFFLCLCFSVKAQDDEGFATFGEELIEDQKDFLGFMLLPGSSDLMRFYQVHINKDGSFKYTQLTMDSFVNRAAGRERTIANPNGVNFFSQFGIKNPGIVGELWKLRYKEYPYQTKGQPEPGWSNNAEYPEMPSPAQFEMLKQFGIERLSSVCYGDLCFMLLSCMENHDWVSRYKGQALSNGGENFSSDGDDVFVD